MDPVESLFMKYIVEKQKNVTGFEETVNLIWVIGIIDFYSRNFKEQDWIALRSKPIDLFSVVVAVS